MVGPATPTSPSRGEGARRKALEEIVRTLVGMGVGKLVLESRNATHDKRDIELLVSMRRRGEATEFEKVTIHGPASGVPL